MGWSVKSLFWNSYQKSLADVRDYEKPIKAADVRDEIQQEKRLDYEARSLMESALTDGTDADGNVTIARIVNQIDTMEWAMRWELDNSLREFGRDAKLGSTFLANRLVERANRLAKGIQPGAKDKLGGALG